MVEKLQKHQNNKIIMEKNYLAQKELELQEKCLNLGKKEVKRLTDEDKKSRQFSISKVTAEDGSLVGWTVDIFEDNNEEKVVSNPATTEENKE